VPNLRLCRETERQDDRDELAPIPFRAPTRPGEHRSADHGEDETMDPIANAQAALEHADAKVSELNMLIDEDIDETLDTDDVAAFQLSSWLDDDDDGPWAA